jgi:hypothetical protein
MATRESASAAKQRHSAELMATSGVSGVGTTKDSDGEWVVEVHVDAGRRDTLDLPPELDGVPVRVVEDGPFRAGPDRSPAT